MTISEAFSALFLARKLFNAATPNSLEEHVCYVLMETVESAIYKKVGFEKGRIYIMHIDHLADGVQWPTVYREMAELNFNISLKGKLF